MYVCQGCFACSKEGSPRLLYTEYRPRTYTNERGLVTTGREPAREIPVCGPCKEELESGIPLERVRAAAEAERLLDERYVRQVGTVDAVQDGQLLEFKTASVFDMLRQSRADSLPPTPSAGCGKPKPKPKPKPDKPKGRTLFERK